jgi:hypothetical protein
VGVDTGKHSHLSFLLVTPQLGERMHLKGVRRVPPRLYRASTAQTSRRRRVGCLDSFRDIGRSYAIARYTASFTSAHGDRSSNITNRVQRT